jgi:decaprenylphospho-beta-D-erythro-pentofuranosid-2-ulose 2-reductase
MIAGLKPPPFAGETDQVANDVLAALDAKKPMLYTPGMWAPVMRVIRNLPRFILRKIVF